MQFIVFGISLIFFVYFQSISIYGGDAGDLVTAAVTGGVAHPPGFPLYILLGNITTKIPILTHAWRMSLISSVSAALALVMVYLFIVRITKSRLAGALTSATLGMSYLFWLYSIVPEVFLLHVFITAALIYVIYAWFDTENNRYILMFALLLGLSLSHHPIIIFSFPAFAYLIIKKKKKVLSILKKTKLKLLGLFLIGLLPNIYIPIAASTHSPVNWNGAPTVQNFVALATRSVYGTFQSGVNIGESILSRFIQGLFYFEFFINDFNYILLVFGLLGGVYLFKKNRIIFNFLLIGYVFTGPIYFFYASYILSNEFNFAIFERFLLPSYIYFSLFMGIGFFALSEYIFQILRSKTASNKLKFRKSNRYIILLGLVMLPLLQLYINYPKLHILKNDLTAEHFAEDLLDTVEEDAIFLVQRDTAIFNSQYVHYVQGYRPDVKLIHASIFLVPKFREAYKTEYPDIIYPNSDPDEEFIIDFIKQNHNERPIYTNVPLNVLGEDYIWLKHGLLFKLYSKDSPPDSEKILNSNKTLWEQYHDPHQGSLGVYKNLMLSNVTDHYVESMLMTGILYERLKEHEEAISIYNRALKYDPESHKIYSELALSHFSLEKCDEAEKLGIRASELAENIAEYHFVLYKVYSECLNDEEKASQWLNSFERLQNERDIELRSL